MNMNGQVRKRQEKQRDLISAEEVYFNMRSSTTTITTFKEGEREREGGSGGFRRDR